MKRARTLRLVTEHPKTKKRLELTIDIAGKKIVKCTGMHNFPDGEVFTSPDARKTEGEVFLDLPVFQGGAVIQGIHLRFEKGRIVHYSAEKGADALTKIIETDDGSHRLGECALGMNAGIKKVLCHPLFVEKTGGTVHLAIGSSYPECYVDDPASEAGRKRSDELAKEGVLNRSAQHVDLVSDFRRGGVGREVWLDETRLRVEDGVWVVP
jgi:aminopeptidase